MHKFLFFSFGFKRQESKDGRDYSFGNTTNPSGTSAVEQGNKKRGFRPEKKEGSKEGRKRKEKERKEKRILEHESYESCSSTKPLATQEMVG